MEKEIKDYLLLSPDSQLDSSMKSLIERWDSTPTSLQILEVLDQCIYASLASGFVVATLQTLYDAQLKVEGKTHQDNVPLAIWRDKMFRSQYGDIQRDD